MSKKKVQPSAFVFRFGEPNASFTTAAAPDSAVPDFVVEPPRPAERRRAMAGAC